jgi:hypothetical protein
METFLNNLLKHIFKAKIIHIKVKRKIQDILIQMQMQTRINLKVSNNRID